VERILVPTDGSELADGVLEPLGPLLRGAGLRELVLLAVLPAVEAEDAGAALDRADVARRRLDGLRDRLALEVPVRVEVDEGDPAERIVARAGEVDLVAMSSHGRGGVLRWVRGSVAERVLRSCPAPLLLWTTRSLGRPAPTGGTDRILVPLDGSDAAAEVLPLVADWARVHGSEVALLGVHPFVADLPMPVPTTHPAYWDPAKVAAGLEPHRERLARAGIPARVEARLGSPAGEILAAAAEADLVAMTTHGRTGVGRWLFGSVAEHVLRRCERPLLVKRTATPEAGR